MCMIHVLTVSTVNKAICNLYNYAESFGNHSGGHKMACFHAVSSCTPRFITHAVQLQSYVLA